MAAVTYLETDHQAFGKAQLLLAPITVKAALQVADLVNVVKRGAGMTAVATLLNVSTLALIRIELWGIAADSNTVTVDLYGWPLAGPGHHIGQVTAIHAGVTAGAGAILSSPVTHSSITGAFDQTLTYRGCDTYVVAADQGVAIDIPVTETDFPGYFKLDFTPNQYEWIAVQPTTVGGTTLGAIFTVLSIKSGYHSPQFTS